MHRVTCTDSWAPSRNLAYSQGIFGRGSPKELDELLDKGWSLAARRQQVPHLLPFGMKQRLGLVYALLGDPQLLSMDEPTNGMGLGCTVEIRDLIR